MGVCEFLRHIWKGDRKNKGKRFFRVQTSGKCEDQVSSFGILGNVNVAHFVRELWMERQENYICGEVSAAAACRAAAVEGVLPLFLGFPVPVFVTAMPVQAVATGSVGITTLEGETDRSPSQEPYGSQASRSLGQQEDSGKVSHDEKFQVFVQGAGLGFAMRVLWVTAHTTVADACFALGLTGVLASDVYGSIGSKLLGWNDRLAQGGARKGRRLVLCRRTRGGGGPRQPLYDEWTCARCEMAGCWATKRSCFRCGLPRAESERIFRSNPKGRIRKVPPREEYSMLQPSSLDGCATPDQRRTGKRWRRQVGEFGEKTAFLQVDARREGRVAGDTERMMDGIFVGHHERTGASLFLSERGLLRGTRVQRKTANQQWDNEFIRKRRGVPWMLIGEDPEVRPPPVPAVMMTIPDAIVRTPQQRRRYILKQDVARYGPTPECEACTTLAARAQRVTKPHSDECRARMEELMQRDEDALLQRLHTDRLRRGSTDVEVSEDERRNPDVEMTGSGLPSGSGGHENPREQKQRLRGVVEKLLSLGQENPCKRRQKMPKQDEV